MKKSILTIFFFSLILLVLSCSSKKIVSSQIAPYQAIDQEIYDQIKAMDTKFFNAYNSCDLDLQAAIYSDDIEFFHDKGGLMTSKQDNYKGTEKNICGKVTRTLIPGSIEVYPIKDFGAVEIGYHKFFNNQEPDAISNPSKFIIFWKRDGQMMEDLQKL